MFGKRHQRGIIVIMSVSRATWSRSRIQRLGKRLIVEPTPASEDIAELHQLLSIYDNALATVDDRLAKELGIRATTRLKTTTSILEKLRRQGGGSLPNIQDLAGARIVEDMNWVDQGALADRIIEIFKIGQKPPKWIDRRVHPSHGYTAVHVVVFLGVTPIEIQIRTKLQHEWANIFEKLADVAGRGIRYGQPPEDWTKGIGRAVFQILDDNNVLRPDLLATIDNWVNIVPQAVEQAIQAASSLSEIIRTSEHVEYMASIGRGVGDETLTSEEVAESKRSAATLKHKISDVFGQYRIPISTLSDVKAKILDLFDGLRQHLSPLNVAYLESIVRADRAYFIKRATELIFEDPRSARSIFTGVPEHIWDALEENPTPAQWNIVISYKAKTIEDSTDGGIVER